MWAERKKKKMLQGYLREPGINPVSWGVVTWSHQNVAIIRRPGGINGEREEKRQSKTLLWPPRRGDATSMLCLGRRAHLQYKGTTASVSYGYEEEDNDLFLSEQL